MRLHAVRVDQFGLGNAKPRPQPADGFSRTDHCLRSSDGEPGDALQLAAAVAEPGNAEPERELFDDRPCTASRLDERPVAADEQVALCGR